MKDLLFSFQGRVNRAPYWYVHLVISAVHIVIFAALVGPAVLSGDPRMMVNSAGAMSLISLLMIPVLWISLAVTVKRCHDRDKSGWWIFIVLVPLIGPIWFLIDVGFLRGTPGPNQYGVDPLVA